MSIFTPFLARFAQFGPNRIFFHKSDCIIQNVLWHSIFIQKNYKKRSNGSKDIAITRIEQSDWSRALESISWEPDFSQTWGFRRKLDNNTTLHFRQFLAKTNNPILDKIPKTLFLGTFGSIWAEQDFSRKIRRCHFFAFMDP